MILIKEIISFNVVKLSPRLFFFSSAVDFVHEALRLLEEEPETAENSDRLKDEKAHASLWLYICMLEANLQEVRNRSH